MATTQFENVTALVKSNVYFSGLCVSHTILLADGTRKTLGVLLPNPAGEALVFNTQVAERMEITSGECWVRIGDKKELFQAGQSFYVAGNSQFSVELSDVVDYICHYEG
ncbi:MAG: pyrimidine/purine nucleoside phosphorylase [Acinetobacter sp.]|nr:pyrimidine/purine nucleoside phosphorylase [Acinetobacter sp.]